jgi:hypothetical protein
MRQMSAALPWCIRVCGISGIDCEELRMRLVASGEPLAVMCCRSLEATNPGLGRSYNASGNHS